jgi:hypothetical protein
MRHSDAMLTGRPFLKVMRSIHSLGSDSCASNHPHLDPIRMVDQRVVGYRRRAWDRQLRWSRPWDDLTVLNVLAASGSYPIDNDETRWRIGIPQYGQ